MIRTILQDGAPVLRQKSLAVETFSSPTVDKLAQDLVDTLQATETAVGLAAPQIGVPIRMIVVALTDIDLYVMVNPKISKPRDEQVVNDGCLSVRSGKEFGRTKRAKRIHVQWQDLNGNEKHQKFSGMVAAIIQHEVDHLDGILFTDRLYDEADKARFGCRNDG
jgi:peptide deformylase